MFITIRARFTYIYDPVHAVFMYKVIVQYDKVQYYPVYMIHTMNFSCTSSPYSSVRSNIHHLSWSSLWSSLV